MFKESKKSIGIFGRKKPLIWCYDAASDLCLHCLPLIQGPVVQN